jgi:hypothetical protein
MSNFYVYLGLDLFIIELLLIKIDDERSDSFVTS